MKKYKTYFKYESPKQTAWDRLSLPAKAEMMKVAVRHGITNLQDIRQKYNEFAEGGQIPPYTPAIDDVEAPEYRDYLRQMAKNREQAFIENYGKSPSAEEFYNNFLSNDGGSFNYRRWYNLASPEEKEWGLKKGLAHWTDASGKTYLHPTFSIESPYSGYVNPYNPKGIVGGTWLNTGDPHNERYEFSKDQMYGDWSINKTLEEFVWARENEDTNPYAVFEGGYVLPEVTVNGKKHSIGGPLVDYALNEYSNGGGIHIKPENHGKFTALKERTGHSATWFKEHGTPAQKKMAVFALNSKKWKHDDGGNLFDGESEPAQQMQLGLNVKGWQPYTLDQILANAEKIRQQEQAIENVFRESQVEPNDNVWVDYSFTMPQKRKNPHLERKAVEGAKQHAAWEKEHPIMTAWGNVLGAAPFAVAAYPLAATAGSGAVALGDAAAATTAGQGITNFLAPVATSTIAGATLPQWTNVGLSSAFGAHGIQTTIDEGGISPTTALELAPMLQVAKPVAEGVATAAQAAYDNGTLWDAYTTFRGRLGNYGDNIFTNMYGTAARRFGLPDKARIPADAMRKLSEEVNFKDGLVDFTGEKGFNGNYHINTSLDRPVVSHSGGNWDRNDLYIFPTRNFLEQTQNALKSIEPSDMFANGAAYREVPKNVTVVSGDTEVLTRARGAGMQTLSSPKLRRLYKKIPAEYQAELDELNKVPLSQRFLVKTRRNAKYNKAYQEYADEVQRLQSQRGTPTLADFRLLEAETGLSAGVAPISEYNNALSGLQNMENTIFSPGAISKIQNREVTPYVFPNGRSVDWSIKSIFGDLGSVQRAKYNNVFYDPTSHVEMNWRFPEGE